CFDSLSALLSFPTRRSSDLIWNIIVFALLIWLRRLNIRRGELFLNYVIMYSIGRFFIEGLRTDSLYFLGLRQAQLISIVLIVAAVGLMIYRRQANLAQKRYDGSTIKTK